MYKDLLIAFILLHVLGDFYFQSETLAEKKNVKYTSVLLHSAIYAAVFWAGLLAVFSPAIAAAAAVLSLMHFAIDSLKYRYVKTHHNLSEPLVYCLDQGAHLFLFFA